MNYKNEPYRVIVTETGGEICSKWTDDDWERLTPDLICVFGDMDVPSHLKNVMYVTSFPPPSLITDMLLLMIAAPEINIQP